MYVTYSLSIFLSLAFYLFSYHFFLLYGHLCYLCCNQIKLSFGPFNTVYECLYVHMYIVCEHALFSFPFLFPFETRSLSEPGGHQLATLAVSKPLRSSCLHHSALESQLSVTIPSPLRGCQRFELRS